MKKILFVVMMFAFGLNASSQVVISNDYGSPIQGAEGQKITEDDEEEMLSCIGVMYYGFKGTADYGFGGYFLNPNGVGFEFAARSDLKFNDYSHLSFDLGINYSFKLVSNDNMKLLLTLAAGASVRNQSYVEYSYNSKGSASENKKEKFYFDGFVNPRISFAVGKVLLSAGYYYWF